MDETSINTERADNGRRGGFLFAASALTALLLAARLAFIVHPTPTHPDEVSFQAALGFPASYPVHAPGYPLWVALGTLLHAVGLPRYASLETWSLIASIAAPLLMFAWLRSLLPARLTWWTAVAFAVCPLAWFHAATAQTYWTATLVALVIVVACHRAITFRNARALWLAAILLSIGVYLRTDCLIYFGPLFAWGLLRVNSLRGRAAALLPLAAFVGFYLLMQFLFGRAGPTVFADRFGHSRDVMLGTSLFGAGLVDGLVRNLVKIGVNLGWDLGPLAFVCAFALLRRRAPGDDRSPTLKGAAATSPHLPRLVAIWILTGLTFLALFHVVEGYFLWLLPAFFIAAALWLNGRIGPARAARWMSIVAILSTTQFLFYPWSVASTGIKRTIDAKIAYLSAEGLTHIDERALIHHDGDVWHIKAHDADTPP